MNLSQKGFKIVLIRLNVTQKKTIKTILKTKKKHPLQESRLKAKAVCEAVTGLTCIVYLKCPEETWVTGL